MNDGGGAGVIHGKLALKPGARLRLAGQLEHERMHFKRDRGHIGSLEPMRVAKLNAAVDGWMNDDPAGEGLVGVERDLPALAELSRDLLRIEFGREHVSKAARRFDGAVGAGEVLLRQMRGKEAVLRRSSGMERLAHGAEHFPQA